MTRNMRLTPYDKAFDEAAAEPDNAACGSRPSMAMEEYSASDYSVAEELMPLFLSGEHEAPRRRGFGTGFEAYQDRPAVWPRIFKAVIFVTLAAGIAAAVASMDDPLALFANAKASLPNTPAGHSGVAALTPADQAAAARSTPRVVTSPPSASVMPTRDEIAAALRVAYQGQPETPQAQAAAPAARQLAADDLKQNSATTGSQPADADKEVLFKQFQAWDAKQNARAQLSSAPKQR